MPPVLLSIIERYINTTTSFISWAPRLAVARLVAKWRSLVTIVVGVILGAGIGALVPLYTTAVAQVGLVQRLEDEAAHDSNVRIRTSFRLADFDSATDYREAVTYLDEQIIRDTTSQYLDTDNFPDWLNDDDIVAYLRSTPMGLFDPSGDALQQLNPARPNDYARTHMLWMADWENRVTFVDGQAPSRAELPEGVNFNVAISTEVANEFGLVAGDILTIDERLDRDGDFKAAPFESSQPFTVQVSGVFSPRDADSSFWMAMRAIDADPERLDTPLRVIQISWPAEFWMFTSRENVLESLTFVPETRSTAGWRLLFNYDELPYSRITEAREALNGFQTDLNLALDIDNSAVVQNFDLANEDEALDLNYNFHTRLIDFSETREDVDNGILLDYDERQSVNFIPFLILLLEVGGLVLIFLVITAALVRRGERREISMLQSRGAFDGQVLALRSIEALLICAFGAMVAPLLAQRLLQLLGPTIAGTDDFPLPLTADVFLWSSLLAAVTFIALTATLIPVLRLPLISYGGAASRSETLAWWQKYYVDVVVAIVALAGFVWLIDRDTPLLDNRQIDPLLVIAPAMLFLGLASLALRAFPLLAGQLSLLSSRRSGLLGSLATWQLSREPIHYGRITFLLALAIGIGWFAMSFQATVQRSQRDQAGYQVGTDIRLYERDTDLNADRVRDTEYYTDASDAVIGANQAFRSQFSLSTSVRTTTADGTGYSFGELLAVEDAGTFEGAVDGWRSDLGDIVVPRSAEMPPSIPVVGEPLPFTPQKIGMWARLQNFIGTGQNIIPNPLLNRLTQRVQLGVRLQDEAGAWVVVPFERQRIEYLRNDDPALVPTDVSSFSDAPGFETASHLSNGWVYYEADLSDLVYDIQGEVRLVSLYWEHRANSNAGEQNLQMTFADMTLFDENATPTPYNILDRPADWSFVQDAGATATGSLSTGTDALRDNLIHVLFGQDAQRTRVGINLNYPEPQPMPAVVSETFAELNVLEFGETTQTLPISGIGRTTILVEPRASVEYFPSLYNAERPFVIIDVRELMYTLNQRPTGRFYPTEIWLNLDDDVSGIAEVNNVIDNLVNADAGVIQTRDVTYAQQFDDLETDPLALGLLGLMFLAFLIALVLSIVGLLTYAALTAQARRGEFGVLRAMGMAPGKVVQSLVLEQLFVVLVAGILGSLLGAVLSEYVVPTLALGATGEGVVPPFITEVEWTAIANFWLIMGVVLTTVFMTSFFLVRQLSLSRTLRLGEE
jgi:ABC-type antimicrobial peptide transport system permease subunit